MVKEELVFTDAEFEPETVTLTRAEIHALNAYADKVRREFAREIFEDINSLVDEYEMGDIEYPDFRFRLGKIEKKYRGNSE
jgi:hypothetical protein